MPVPSTSISVILPNFNHAHLLPYALSALVQQNPPPGEILVVDDASTDNSVAVIESFQRRHRFIRLIRHEVNKGVEAAVRNALHQTKADYLLFAAADDFVLPGLFARAISALDECPEAAFFCAEVALVDEGDKVIAFRPPMIPRVTAGYMSPSDVRRAMRASDNWFVGTSIVYRHSRLAEIGYFDQSLATLQDAMATRLLAFRHGFYFVPEVLATWRVSFKSLSGRASLSLSDNERMLAKAQTWIAANFPVDVKIGYAELFDRRLRFNFARARLVWRHVQPDINSIADVLKWRSFDRAVLRLASKIPLVSSQVILAWMTIRVRPFALKELAIYFWRGSTMNRKRRGELAKIIQSRRIEDTPA